MRTALVCVAIVSTMFGILVGYFTGLFVGIKYRARRFQRKWIVLWRGWMEE